MCALSLPSLFFFALCNLLLFILFFSASGAFPKIRSCWIKEPLPVCVTQMFGVSPQGREANPLTASLKLFKRLFWIGTNWEQHDDRFSGCGLRFASDWAAALGLRPTLTFNHHHPLFLPLFFLALLGEWGSQYAGGWTAWFLQQESFTWQVDLRFLYFKTKVVFWVLGQKDHFSHTLFNRSLQLASQHWAHSRKNIKMY